MGYPKLCMSEMHASYLWDDCDKWHGSAQGYAKKKGISVGRA